MMNGKIASSGEAVSTTNPSQAIIERIADLEGICPTELTPPLYSAVDPDALDALVSSPAGESSVSVRFTYKEYDIRITSGGSVSIDQPEDAKRSVQVLEAPTGSP